MALISFGKLSLLLIFPFCASIFSVFRFLILFFANKYNQTEHSVLSAFSSSSTLLCFYMFVGEALNGLFLIPNCIKTIRKKYKTETIIAPEENYISGFSEKKKPPYVLIFLIILFSLIDCAGNLFLHEISKANPALTTLQNFQIIFTVIIAYFILHISWYKHQFLSFSIIVIGSVISFFFFDVSTYVEKNIYLFLMFGILIFLALQEVLEKTVYISGMTPDKLLLFEGSCGMILCLLITTASTVAYMINSSWLKFFERNSFSFFWRINELIFINGANVLFLIGYIVANMLYSLFIKWSNYNFTPMSRAISDTISIFITNFIYQNDLRELTITNNIFVIIGFAFILMGCLLYNEIIRVTWCGLDKNTKKEIAERSTLDTWNLELELKAGANTFDQNENEEMDWTILEP